MWSVASLGFSPAQPAKASNMNGKYVVASGNTVGVPFESDYAAKGEPNVSFVPRARSLGPPAIASRPV